MWEWFPNETSSRQHPIFVQIQSNRATSVCSFSFDSTELEYFHHTRKWSFEPHDIKTEFNTELPNRNGVIHWLLDIHTHRSNILDPSVGKPIWPHDIINLCRYEAARNWRSTRFHFNRRDSAKPTAFVTQKKKFLNSIYSTATSSQAFILNEKRRHCMKAAAEYSTVFVFSTLCIIVPHKTRCKKLI